LLAAAHPRQAERIAALRSYDILDTPKEADFDDIVRLASEICGAPISVINLIDVDRQWFKAEVGLGVRETPLDTSICSHAILEKEFVEIPDTLADPRMQDNALCTGDPGLRFYAGALLQTEEGLPLGTLCVLDYKPRALDTFQRNALRVLSRQVMTQLDLRLALKRQELMHKETDHRVKNSLASVAAMVRMQLLRAKDPDLRSALDSVEQRVRTIALLHEELYRTSSGDEADLARYLKKLQGMMQDGAPPNIVIDVEAAPMMVNSVKASAVGKIVSEFVMNSVKYAFPDGRAGRISIALRPAGANAELVCTDDGIGAGEIRPSQRGLGLRLMEAYASQIGGAAEFADARPGVRLQVTFSRD
jgi:two-component sensor histidine kinase